MLIIIFKIIYKFKPNEVPSLAGAASDNGRVENVDVALLVGAT